MTDFVIVECPDCGDRVSIPKGGHHGVCLRRRPLNRPNMCAYCFQNQHGRCDGFRYTWPTTLSKSLCACALNDHGRLYA